MQTREIRYGFRMNILYNELPDYAITLKVGHSKTLAKYSLESFKEVRELLMEFSKV